MMIAGVLLLLPKCYTLSLRKKTARVSILTRDIDIANLSVCLSICPSVTFQYQTKTA